MTRITQRYAAAFFAGQDIADMDPYQPTVYPTISRWCHGDGLIAAVPPGKKLDTNRPGVHHELVEVADQYLNARGWRIFVTPDLVPVKP